MALRPPGSRSNIDLLIFGALAMVQVILLIGGHVLVGYVLLENFGIGKGMADASKLTGLPVGALWLLIAATLVMDGWIFYHKRLERKKALQR